MLHIAVIEDNRQDRELIVSYIKRYGDENGCGFKTTGFDNAVTFITNYNPVYDAIFIDIQMPYMNGMELAGKLRKLDSSVLIVFITNMSNFAINGYAVDAVDFIVKPVSYNNFAAMMSKVMKLSAFFANEIMLRTQEGGRRLKTNEIRFVEIMDHKLIYHTDKEDIEIWGTLKDQEIKLENSGFARCNNYCLVNLKYIDRIRGGCLEIGDCKIPLTRTRKKEFMTKLVEFYGDTF